MEPCHLNYIPDRLCTNDREAFQTFEVGELIFFRCKEDVQANPYLTITIAELSHNRGGPCNNPLSNPEDVLYNIREDEEEEMYKDKVVCTIKILDLNEENKYDKLFIDPKKNEARMSLIHEPESCMFPHCVFRVWYNGELTEMDNKEHKKKYKELRGMLKEELTRMLLTNTLSQAV